MTYPPGGQPPYGEPQYPGQPGQQGQPYGYPQQQGYPQQGYPPPGGPQQGYGPPGMPQQGYPGGYQQPPRKKRTGLIIGLAVALLVVVGGVAAGVVLTVQGKTPLASDEKKVEVAIRDFYKALDDDGVRAAANLACKADRDDFNELSESEKSETEKADISVTISKVENIVITGDKATAKVTGKFSISVPGEGDPDTDNSADETLKKEDGKWKVCSSDSDS